MKIDVVIAALALGLAGCGAGDGRESEGGAAAGVQDQQAAGGEPRGAALSRVDPCSLLTKEEMAAEVEMTLEASQREARRQKGVTYAISAREVPAAEGFVRKCELSWQSVGGDDGGAPSYKGAFTVEVMTAEIMHASAGGSRTPEPIPGVGDEAFFVHSVPYARVGDVAVSISNFPDTRDAKRGLGLLRIAVTRLR